METGAIRFERERVSEPRNRLLLGGWGPLVFSILALAGDDSVAPSLTRWWTCRRKLHGSIPESSLRFGSSTTDLFRSLRPVGGLGCWPSDSASRVPATNRFVCSSIENGAGRWHAAPGSTWHWTSTRENVRQERSSRAGSEVFKADFEEAEELPSCRLLLGAGGPRTDTFGYRLASSDVCFSTRNGMQSSSASVTSEQGVERGA